MQLSFFIPALQSIFQLKYYNLNRERAVGYFFSPSSLLDGWFSIELLCARREEKRLLRTSVCMMHTYFSQIQTANPSSGGTARTFYLSCHLPFPGGATPPPPALLPPFIIQYLASSLSLCAQRRRTRLLSHIFYHPLDNHISQLPKALILKLVFAPRRSPKYAKIFTALLSVFQRKKKKRPQRSTKRKTFNVP